MATLLVVALPLFSAATVPDASICRGKQLLYVMSLREVAAAKAEVPYRPELVKLKEDVLVDDNKTVEHLKSLGFVVTTCDPETCSVELAKGKDLVVISESINAVDIGSKYTRLPIPIVCWENDLYDDLRMTGKRLNVDYGTNRTKALSLQFFNGSHPLSAGVSSGTSDVYAQPKEINWGRPGPGATIIAAIPGDLDKVATFAYEKGATMSSEFPAPARRVALFLNQNVFGSLNPEGLALFDAAMTWAVTPPPSPTSAALDPGVAHGKQVLYVMNLREVDLLKSEVPSDPARIKAQEQVKANDYKIVEHLKSLGFVMTPVDEHPAVDGLNGKDLVIISDSVNARQIQAKYKLLPLPVITWASDLYGDMGMTGRKRGEDSGTTGTPGGKDGDRFASMVNAPHPLSAGLDTDGIEDLYDDNEYITNWGRPTLGAINIATIAGYPDKRTIFGYEKGAAMDGGLIAPARRVAFYLHTYDFGHIQPDGLKLLDAAAFWAVSNPQR